MIMLNDEVVDDMAMMAIVVTTTSGDKADKIGIPEPKGPSHSEQEVKEFIVRW